MFDKDSRLRAAIIATLFILGVVLVFFGWTMKGQINGLIIMLFGVVLLLATIFVYNKPYK